MVPERHLAGVADDSAGDVRLSRQGDDCQALTRLRLVYTHEENDKLRENGTNI